MKIQLKENSKKLLLAAVVENAKMDIPEVMVEKEIDAMIKELRTKIKISRIKLRTILPIHWNRC